MKCPLVPEGEPERLQALAEYGLVPGRSLPSLDPVVRIARSMFNMAAAAVNMVGSEHVFAAAAAGIGEVDMRRDVSFCAHAILGQGVMVVPDTTLDERFHDNPLVTGPANLRFYAGVPLHAPGGHALGALCVVDGVPHPEFSREDCARLADLAQMAIDRLELRRIELAALRVSPGPRPLAEMAAADGCDQLTGTIGRRGFFACIEALLERPAPAMLAVLDINGFKDINNTLGQEAGDSILCEVAARLQSAAPPGGTVARLGGDEFAVLIPGQAGAPIAQAQHLLDRIAAPMQLGTQPLSISAACGLALAPSHAAEALELIGSADLALDKARQERLATPYLYTPALRQEAVSRRLYGMELFRALSNAEFELYYQPQVRLADNELAGAEALLRWRHPRDGLLTPDAFLPVLERGPLAGAVGSWVLNEACAQAAAWHRLGETGLRMGVNLFAAQLREPNFGATVESALSCHNLPPEALELEITETVALSGAESAVPVLRRLHDAGIGIAFDDFGTGYASFAELKRFPLSRLKIDRSFVQGMVESRRDASVVHAILDMAREFGLETTAEGVETETQCAELRREGSQQAQGYLFGRPMPAAAFTAQLQLLRQPAAGTA